MLRNRSKFEAWGADIWSGFLGKSMLVTHIERGQGIFEGFTVITGVIAGVDIIFRVLATEEVARQVYLGAEITILSSNEYELKGDLMTFLEINVI